MLRPRKDSESLIQRVHDIAVKYQVTVPDVPLDGMLNDVKLVAAIQPFEDIFRLGLKLCEDTAAQADTEAWQAFLAYYGVLSRMAMRHAEIAAALEPVAAAMRKPKRRQPGAAAAAPAAATGTGGAVG